MMDTYDATLGAGSPSQAQSGAAMDDLIESTGDIMPLVAKLYACFADSGLSKGKVQTALKITSALADSAVSIWGKGENPEGQA
jgi:hypothetical protein